MPRKSNADIQMAAESDKWRAEDDARTLECAAEIQNDKKRLNSAVNHVKQKADKITKAYSTKTPYQAKGRTTGKGKAR
jgi:hypothetical protein